MEVTYTYEGQRDREFEDAILGEAERFGSARQVRAAQTADGLRSVTLSVEAGTSPADLAGHLRRRERIVDLLDESGRRFH